MKIFRKKFKTADNGTTYYTHWSFGWNKKNPWCSGTTLTLTLPRLGTFGFAICIINSFATPNGKGGLKQHFHFPRLRVDIWYGLWAREWELSYDKKIGRTWSLSSRVNIWSPYRNSLSNEQFDKPIEYGFLAQVYIKDFIFAIMLDPPVQKLQFGFWELRRSRKYWSPGFNDHQFPTTDYGRFILSLSPKQRKRYLAVEKALRGPQRKGTSGVRGPTGYVGQSGTVGPSGLQI